MKVFFILTLFFFSFKTLGFLQCTLYKYLIIDGKNIFKYLWEMRESKNGYLRPWNHVSNCNKLQRNQRKIQSHTWDLFSINLLKESPLIIHPFFKSVKNFISQNIGENYTASKKDFRSETDSSLWLKMFGLFILYKKNIQTVASWYTNSIEKLILFVPNSLNTHKQTLGEQ